MFGDRVGDRPRIVGGLRVCRDAADGVEHVEAAWEFEPTGPGQLKMKKGDVLQVVNRPSADWVTVKNPSTSEQVRPCN